MTQEKRKLFPNSNYVTFLTISLFTLSKLTHSINFKQNNQSLQQNKTILSIETTQEAKGKFFCCFFKFSKKIFLFFSNQKLKLFFCSAKKMQLQFWRAFCSTRSLKFEIEKKERPKNQSTEIWLFEVKLRHFRLFF